MQTIAVALGLAGGLGLICWQSAGAAPAAGMVIRDAATAAAVAQPAQYREYRTRRHLVKCYRDWVVGPYRCHYHGRNW